MTTHGLYIDGAYAKSAGEESSIRNPATGEEIARVARATAADVDRAVAIAHQRYREGVWRQASVRDRRDVLRRIADLVRRDLERLARMESQNAGKPIAAARGEIGAVAASFDYSRARSTSLAARRCRATRPARCLLSESRSASARRSLPGTSRWRSSPGRSRRRSRWATPSSSSRQRSRR